MIIRVHVQVSYWHHVHVRDHDCVLSEKISMIVLISINVRELNVLNLLEESFHLGLHCGVGLFGGFEFVCVFGGGCCTLVLVDLEALHHLIYNSFSIGIVESQFVYCYSGFHGFRVSFLEVVFEVISCFVRRIGAFPCPDVVFEDSFFVVDNKGEFYCLTLG